MKKGQIVTEKELYAELRDGHISTLEKYAPLLIPDLPESLRISGNIVEINRRIYEKSDRWTPLTPIICARIRMILEQKSFAKYGVKLRTDRGTVAEYLGILAEDHRKDNPDWIEELPAWDEIPRLDHALDQWLDLKHSSDPVKFNRTIFMVPVARKLGKVCKYNSEFPIIIHDPAHYRQIVQLISRIVRGSELIATTEEARSQKEFAEALDMGSSHAILPEIMQLSEGVCEASRERFRSYQSAGYVHYRRPNIGASEGEKMWLPLLIGTFGDPDPPTSKHSARFEISRGHETHYPPEMFTATRTDKIGGSKRVYATNRLTVWYDPDMGIELPSKDLIDQIYAEAMCRI